MMIMLFTLTTYKDYTISLILNKVSEIRSQQTNIGDMGMSSPNHI